MNVKLQARVNTAFKVAKGDLIVFKSGEEVLVTGGVVDGYRGVILGDMGTTVWCGYMDTFLSNVVSQFGEIDYIVCADKLELVEVK